MRNACHKLFSWLSLKVMIAVVMTLNVLWMALELCHEAWKGCEICAEASLRLF